MRISFIFFILSFLSAQYNYLNYGSITTLLTPTAINSYSDNIIYITTSGGLLKFNIDNKKFTPIKMAEGLDYLDLLSINIDKYKNIWLGGNSPYGGLQVYNSDYGLLYNFNDELISSINKIVIHDTIYFGIYKGLVSGDVGVLKFTS